VDAGTSTVTIGDREDLLRDELVVRDPLFAVEPAADEAVLVQVRAHGEPFLGRWKGDRVVCAEPQPRVSPGQVIALYRGDVLLGGGIAA
jgi:tRNA-specific 2-thiouridylase